MLDRRIEPEIHDFDSLKLPEADYRVLPNGVPLYVINMGDQEVNRIDIMFSAGKYEQSVPLAAEVTNAMLKEGCKGLTSVDIAEKLDFYGAWLQCSVTYHNSYITLYSLNRSFGEVLPLLESVVYEPVFPEKEFRTYIDRSKQRLLVEQEKVQTLVNRTFFEQLFGKKHPYGYPVESTDYDRLTISDLKEYHRNFYSSEYCKIVLSGKISEDMIDIVSRCFGQRSHSSIVTPEVKLYPFVRSDEHFRYVEKSGALQSAVRIGMPVIGREHPDYMKLRILNTVLGGYFGSRLMLNIREDKGFTYGISSSVIGLKQDAYLSVFTQTGNEFVKPLIEEVFIEIERLCNEKIGKEELAMVRSYLIGELARIFDGPFSICDAYISLIANQLDLKYYDRQFEIVRGITSEELQEIASKYFIKDSFYTAVAGQMQ
ncbi:M16 family metallopeptidase [Coprobacter sp.]